MGKRSTPAGSRASIVHEAIRGGIWGLGTDKKALLRALDDLSPDDAAVLRDEYAKHYHRDLMADLLRDLHHGSARHRALAAVSGAQSKAEAWAFHEELKAGYSRPKAVLNRLRRVLETKTYSDVDDQFRLIQGLSLTEALKRGLTGEARERALGWLARGEGDVWSNALEESLHPLLPERVQPGVILALLKQAPPQAEQQFLKVEQTPLREVLATRLHGDDLSLAIALLDGDRIRAAAIIAHAALADDRAGPAMLLEAFDNTSIDQRARISRAYSQLYDQSFEEDVQNKGGVTRAVGKRIFDSGRKELVDELRALRELGAVDIILSQLQTLPAPLIQVTDKLYAHHYGISLYEDLAARFPRDRQRDLQKAWEGKSSDPLVRATCALETWNEVRSGGKNAPARMVLDHLLRSPQGQLIDGTAQALRETLAKAKGDVSWVPELNVLVRFLEEDLRSYQHARMEVTQGAIVLGSLATGTAMFALGGISLPFLTTASTSTGLNGGWRMFAKAMFLGNAYTGDDLKRDLAWSLGAGVGSALAGLAAQDVARPLADLIASSKTASSDYGVAAQSYWHASMLRPLTVPLEHALQSAGLFGGATLATTSLEKRTWANGVGSGVIRVSLAGLKGVSIGLGYGALQSAISIALGLTPNANFIDESAKSSMVIQTPNGPQEVLLFGEVTNEQKAVLIRELQGISDKTGGRALVGLDSVYVHPMPEDLGGYMNSAGSIAISDWALGPTGNTGVIAHELGHHMDPGQPGFLPKGAWVAIFGDGSPFGTPPYVTDYASLDRWEDFAETHEALLQQWNVYTAPDAESLLQMTDPLWPKVKWILDNVYPNSIQAGTT